MRNVNALGNNRIISDQDFSLIRLALYFSIAVFKVTSSNGLRLGSHFRMSAFNFCRGQSPCSGTPSEKCVLKYLRMRGCLPGDGKVRLQYSLQ